jgi:hypothetical protein
MARSSACVNFGPHANVSCLHCRRNALWRDLVSLARAASAELADALAVGKDGWSTFLGDLAAAMDGLPPCKSGCLAWTGEDLVGTRFPLETADERGPDACNEIYQDAFALLREGASKAHRDAATWRALRDAAPVDDIPF